ncbi:MULTISPECIES: tripartite tricarboxylate transporter TctB family protein [Microbacterium]|uniref:tripartite tricarboxylate transporter TctB family protein n=1 Tax=Microbacterium TaxID=33882 RepID=UPI00277F4FFE|nr:MULTISPECIES: tripartite tricarboxylate transporter TctB family protein [Microbacterium]MDQ1075672.1 putative tricarboxylic transport membrane protein [Microbacterium sp. SORGH_AS_0969]MDQ1115914.1 putative tricarboxylic transport membrane protein [Microbacterium testaceum]
MTEPSTLTTGSLRVQRTPRWYTGRSELVVVAGVFVLAGFMTYGTATMQVPADVAFPGPQFFPMLVSCFLWLAGIGLLIEVLRTSRRAHVADDPVEISNEMLEDLGAIDATGEIRIVSPEDVASTAKPAAVDWRTLGVTVAALAGFIVVLPVLGWILSAAALFWAISWAFGSRRPLLDIGVSVIVSSLVQLAFGAGLGLSLPAGILEGLSPWIS